MAAPSPGPDSLPAPLPTATQLIQSIERADDSSAEALLPLVYDELRRLAESYMRQERRDHTLQATALVHEAYARLVDQTGMSFNNKAHFLGVAARAMRQVLIDHARRQNAQKRGGGQEHVALTDADLPAPLSHVDLLALNAALEKLTAHDERCGRVVEMRFFGGLTIAETAAALNVSHTTIEEDWAFARTWLTRELSD